MAVRLRVVKRAAHAVPVDQGLGSVFMGLRGQYPATTAAGMLGSTALA